MRRAAPSLDELRARVHKGRHREIGNWLARRWARPAAVYGTWLAVRLGLSAHAVTTLALLTGLAAAVAMGTGTRAGFGAGAIGDHRGEALRLARRREGEDVLAPAAFAVNARGRNRGASPARRASGRRSPASGRGG